ncbi:MAG: hypothetical protein Q8Q60_04225 [Candidatus Chromulinivorax sp.]|nr:hypothetical protein [Candidatus Chromulinivorax sp.]
MNNPRQSLDKKIEDLEFWLKGNQEDFKSKYNTQLTQFYKDNITKLYTDAITKLQEQKAIKQGLQSAYKNMNMESPELQSIINKSNNFNEINKKFIDLLMTTNDSMIPRNIELLVTELGRTFLSDNKITELQLLAHEKNNIQDIVNRENFKNSTLDFKLATLQEDAQKSIPSEREMREKNISQDYKDNVIKLYQDAITKLKKQDSLAQKNKDIQDNLARKKLANISKDTSLTHQEKLTSLQANRNLKESNNLTIEHDEVIAKMKTISKTDVLNHDINALRMKNEKKGTSTSAYIANSLSILAKQGSLNARAIASKISGIFKQSGVKNTDGKATRTISVEAAKNAPDKGASQQTITNWINNYITQPINNLITKNREIKVTLTRKQSEQRAEEIFKKTPNYDGKIIDLQIIMNDQHPTTDVEGFTTYKGTSGEYQISVIVDKNGIITKSYSEPLINTKPIVSKNQPSQAINPAAANYREIAEEASRV